MPQSNEERSNLEAFFSIPWELELELELEVLQLRHIEPLTLPPWSIVHGCIFTLKASFFTTFGVKNKTHNK